jgi:bifunctional non-homologous end joining protein LigD
VTGWDPEEHQESVTSGRTNDDVAAEGATAGGGAAKAGAAKAGAAKAGAAKGGAATRRKASRTKPKPPTWKAPTKAELAALDALGTKGEWVFQGRTLALTNLDKVLFPGGDGEAPATKRDLIRYHAQVAPAMLPYLHDRPVNLHRFPDGVTKAGFWHKAVPSHAPDWIPRWRNADADPGETEWYFVVDSPPALAWMANYGAVELHPWTSSGADPHAPTWALIDVDPGSRTTWDQVLVLTRLYRTALEHLDVVARPKVTGQRGVQIWVPIRTGYSFDDTRAWVEKLSRAVGQIVPDLVSWTWTKRDRKGLARLDYTQNAINKTLVAPWSARAAPRAPVSVPLQWEELDDADLRPDRWTVRTALERLASAGDPFADLLRVEQDLPPL